MELRCDRLWLYLLGGAILVFLAAPSVVVAVTSFSDSQFLTFPPETWSLRWYHAYADSIEWRAATFTSLKVAFLTTLIATPAGTAAAYSLRMLGTRFSGAVQAIYTMPMVVPVILIGISLFFMFARIGLNTTVTGVVLAHSMLAVPFVVITVGSGLANYDFAQETAARSLGAYRLKAFLTITLPQIRVPVITGALFAFLTSFDEVIVAIFISGGDSETLPRRMFTALREQIDPTIAAISTCLIIITGGVLLAVQAFGFSGKRSRS